MVKVQDKTTGRFIGNKYVKINGVWYKGKCTDCGKLITSHLAKQCLDCKWRGKRRPVVAHGVAIPHYHRAHYYIAKIAGKPNQCEKCNKTDSNTRKFHWANLSGLYRLDRSDWLRLCVSCHKKMDNNRKGAKV